MRGRKSRPRQPGCSHPTAICCRRGGRGRGRGGGRAGRRGGGSGGGGRGEGRHKTLKEEEAAAMQVGVGWGRAWVGYASSWCRNESHWC